jgi:hypothetical protein
MRFFDKEYCESLRHQSIYSEGSRDAPTGTQKACSKMGPQLAIAHSEKRASHSIKIAFGLTATTSNG